MKQNRGRPWTEISGVLEQYDLGELVQTERNERGYLNTSFEIETIRHGTLEKYFLRRYRVGTLPEEIQFEHAIINHLLEREFTLVAKIFPTREGKTFVSRPDITHPGRKSYYTIFEYLPGEDKYTWIGPECTVAEIENAAAILAAYHAAVAGFHPPGYRAEPGILDLVPVFAENLEKSIEISKKTHFDACLQENLGQLLKNCEETARQCRDLSQAEVPRLVIHSDFHPGNLRFKGEEIVAMFDFDWSKIDLRVFDVGLALWYFFSSWKTMDNGVVRTEDAERFLDNYQRAVSQHSGIGPLNQHELEILPVMINLGNLYVLNWTVTDYYAKTVDVDEYLIYLQHHISFNRWYAQAGKTELGKMLARGFT
jgi:homoserine kinase type II